MTSYLLDMSRPSTYGDGLMLETALAKYKRPIFIVSSDFLQGYIYLSNPSIEECGAKCIFLGFIGKDHYVSILPWPTILSNQDSAVPICIANTEMSKHTLNSAPCKNIPAGIGTSNSTIVFDSTQYAEVHEDDVPIYEISVSDHSTFQNSLLLLPNMPNQPSVESIHKQYCNKRRRYFSFQKLWYELFPWIHVEAINKTVLCFNCAKADSLHLCDLARKRELTFVTIGFKNWRKASKKFSDHQKTAAHVFATEQLAMKSHPTIDAQIVNQKAKEQAIARKCLKIIFTSIQYMARQGLAIRGHENDNGNFKELLQLRSEDVLELQGWLSTRYDMTSSVRQNEILDMFSCAIVRKICRNVCEMGSYAIIVDGTQDIAGKEQQSVCIRYVDKDFNPVEAFVGMYEAPDTKGQTIANCIIDVLTRLQLSLVHLRGQTYDGASNMSGVYNGCQAIISEHQHLALYTHCGSHCTNLIAEKMCSVVPLVQNSMQIVKEIGAVFSASITCRATCSTIAHSSDLTNMSTVKKIRPLCPTRWLVRVSAIRNILEQYAHILQTMEELAVSKQSVAARANGLAIQLRHGSTLLGMHIAIKVLAPLENLNKSLQSRTATVAGMLKAVNDVQTDFEHLRSEVQYNELFTLVKSSITDFDIEDIVLPRPKKPPGRFTGAAPSYQASSASDYYLPQYLEIIDVATTGLKQRFSESKGYQQYGVLENILLTGTFPTNFTTDSSHAAEFHVDELVMQLGMFTRKYAVKTVSDATIAFQQMVPEVRELFSQVEILLRLLLICPAFSAEAERSFSGLRRLKTWLRSTMTQRRLNSVCVCHTHQELLDSLEIHPLMVDFCSRSDIRQKLFGRF